MVQIRVDNLRVESSGRLKSLKVISDTLAERVFQVENVPTGLFPVFRLDAKTVKRNIFNKKRPTVFQHMAKFHNQFGIRHLFLVGLLALYSTGGGLMFLAVEHAPEVESLKENIIKLDDLTLNLARALLKATNVSSDETNVKHEVILLIRDYYQRMLKVEGKFIGSAYHKYEMIGQRLTWRFGSAVFYAMTLFTSIGYGSIACQTELGKALSVGYSVVGIPLMLVVLSDVGQVLLRWFTLAYNHSRALIAKARDRLLDSKMTLPALERDSLSSWGSDDSQLEPFPIYLAVPIIVVYMLVCAGIVCLFDFHDGNTPGLSFWNCFYYTFMSISTIGLGDVLPNNIEYSPYLSLMFLFGLALLSVVNSTVYLRLQERFLTAMDSLEDWLESLHYHRHGREGYMVFKALGPNIQLLALALPLFDDESKIEAMLEPENTSLGKRLFAPKPSRSRSMAEEYAPTLGVFNLASMQSRRNRAHTVAGHLHSEPAAGHAPRVKRTFSEQVRHRHERNSLRPRTQSALLAVPEKVCSELL